MSIKAGDRAVIVEGALGTKGPNIGKEVTVGMTIGPGHSKFGRIVEVFGEGLVSEFGAVGNSTQCAASWLRKIEPPKQTTTDKTEREVKA